MSASCLSGGVLDFWSMDGFSFFFFGLLLSLFRLWFWEAYSSSMVNHIFFSFFFFEHVGEVKFEQLWQLGTNVNSWICDVAGTPTDRWCLGCCTPSARTVKGFIPDDGVICDLGNASLNWMVSCFGFLLLRHYTPGYFKSRTEPRTDDSKCVTGRLLGQKSPPALKSWLWKWMNNPLSL